MRAEFAATGLDADRNGTTQTTYFERNLDDCAWTVLHAWLLLVAEGRLARRAQCSPPGCTPASSAGAPGDRPEAR